MLPRLVRENRFAVLDLETTGVNPRRDETIQLAVIQIDYGRPRIRASSYVQPKRASTFDALAAHGITDAILEHAPKLAEVAPDLLHLVGDRCLLGFGINYFDYPLLQRQLAEHSIAWSPQVLDVLVWERRLAPKEKGARHNLAACVERWGIPKLAHHDALNDCRMTWNVFLALASRFPDFGDLDLALALTKAVDAPLPEGIAL